MNVGLHNVCTNTHILVTVQPHKQVIHRPNLNRLDRPPGVRVQNRAWWCHRTLTALMCSERDGVQLFVLGSDSHFSNFAAILERVPSNPTFIPRIHFASARTKQTARGNVLFIWSGARKWTENVHVHTPCIPHTRLRRRLTITYGSYSRCSQTQGPWKYRIGSTQSDQ